MLQAAAEFGLTPSARTRIMAAVSADKESEDEMEALLGGGMLWSSIFVTL